MFKNQKWRLIINEVSDYAMSASLADSVFQLSQDGKSGPAIIFNKAHNAYLVIAHNQRVNHDVDQSILRMHGIKLLRRRMGGKAIFVTPNDLFYQIIGSVQNASIDKRIVMKEINLLFAKGLNNVANKNVIVQINEDESTNESMNSIIYRACYLSSFPYEISVKGKKLGGFTHMAKGEIFLHEGYLPYGNYAEQLMHLLKARPGEDKEQYYHIISENTTSLKEVIDLNVTYEKIIESIVNELKNEFSIDIGLCSFTKEEKELAQKIFDEKYNHDVWIYRR